MPLNPSRKDTVGPPPRDVSDLSAVVRHQASQARSIDPGLQDGRWRTPRPLVGGMPQVVGGDAGGDGEETAWEYDDRATIGSTGTQYPHLSHEPREEALFVWWHPGGFGGIRMTNDMWTVDGQTVTIPDPGYFAVGDTFSFQYEYLIEEDEPITPSVVGFTAPGVWDSPTKTVTYAMPTGTAAGDLLVLTVRGEVAAGGGELILDVSTSDSRMHLAYKATSLNGPVAVVETIWVGTADGSGSPIVVNVTQNPSFNAAAVGGLAAITGVNGYSTVSATETGGTTPTVTAAAAVAVTWIRSTSFGSVDAAAPSGYTLIGSTGFGYESTGVSWWFDVDAGTSPAGTFTGEGCCVIALV